MSTKANTTAQPKLDYIEAGFGYHDKPDFDVMPNYSDLSFGGDVRSGSSFALEEILMHSSSQLLRMQDAGDIPQQREGTRIPGEGKSHAQAISNVQFEVKIDTTKEVKGPNGESMKMTIYGGNASKIYDAFKKARGESFGPKEFAKELIKQGIVEKRQDPSPTTVLCQVAPAFSQRLKPLEDAKKELENINKFIKEKEANQETVSPALLAQQKAAETKYKELLATQGGHATGREVGDFFHAVDAGVEALVQSKQDQGVELSNIHYPGGWFGCGAYSTPPQLSALTQIALTQFRGINLVFHNFAPGQTSTRTEQYKEAMDLFNEHVKPLIKEGATRQEVLDKIKEIAAKQQWPLGSLTLT